jgi:hypothetical protein
MNKHEFSGRCPANLDGKKKLKKSDTVFLVATTIVFFILGYAIATIVICG